MNRALLDRTAEELLKTETLNQPQIEALKRKITTEPVSASSGDGNGCYGRTTIEARNVTMLHTTPLIYLSKKNFYKEPIPVYFALRWKGAFCTFCFFVGSSFLTVPDLSSISSLQRKLCGTVVSVDVL